MIYLVLLLLSLSYPLSTIAEDFSTSEKSGQEVLLCRKCGSDVADSHYLFYKQSPGARKTEKQNLFGKRNVTVQTLVNPFGIKFEVVTTEKARCENFGRPEGADSWFPGYAWRICACPRCGQHIGWTFDSVLDKDKEKPDDYANRFHGLILSNILGENYKEDYPAAQKQDALNGIRYRFPYNVTEDIPNVNENLID